MRYSLTALSGTHEGMIWLLDASLSIGRDRSNSIFLDDSSVSRRHCEVEAREDGHFVRDLDSSNGTYVNGVPVAERRIEPGDQVRVGRTVFRYAPHDEHEARALAAGVQVGKTQVLRAEDSIYRRPGALTGSPEGRTQKSFQRLIEFMSSFGAARDEERLKRHIVDSLLEATGAGRGALLAATEGESGLACIYETHPGMRVAEAVARQVMADDSGLLSNEVSDAETAGETEASSILAVPLRGSESVFGLVYLDTKDPRRLFDHDHLQLASAMAAVAAPHLESALRIARLEAENRRLQEEIRVEHDMAGDSARMRAVFAFIAKAAPSQATVLIRGESGTGKELVARAIHRNSPRVRGPFQAINCAALTESLLESELFGHEKGAFTGAVAQKRGRIEEAAGGTLFLDEIGELAAPLQAKLLRVIQEREFERVGGVKPIRADIRLVAATHRDLEAMVKSGAFRQDLYYRLNVVSVAMPALRERREDIGLLAEYFVRKHGRGIGRAVKGLSPAARHKLNQYDWPGNVRELENAVERALVLGSSEYIQADDLPEGVAEAGAPLEAESAGGEDFHEQVKAAKRQIVVQALEQAGQDYNEAARKLGLHPSNLYRLVRNLGVRK